MPNKMLLIGGAIFGASVLLVLVLLVTSGGGNKSRQFAVLGELLSGSHGAASRGLLIAAFVGIAIGALTCFGAVGKGDAARRQRCQDSCAERGYKSGKLGLSESRDANGRPNKVCRCSGGSETDLEIDPEKLSE